MSIFIWLLLLIDRDVPLEQPDRSLATPERSIPWATPYQDGRIDSSTFFYKPRFGDYSPPIYWSIPGFDDDLVTDPNLENMESVIDELFVDEEIEERTRQEVNRLAAETFAERESAMNELMGMPSLALNLIQAAAQSTDAESAYRARRVLDHPNVKAQSLEYFRQLERLKQLLRRAKVVWQEPEGEADGGSSEDEISEEDRQRMVVLLGEFVPRLEQLELWLLAGDALSVLADQNDETAIRHLIDSDLPARRLLGIRAATRLQHPSWNETLFALTQVDDALVELAASHSLADRGDFRALISLVRLLEAEDVNVRSRSLQVLRGFTRQSFDLNPYSEPSENLVAVEQWRDWIASVEPTSQFRFPVPLEPLAENLNNGLLLHYTFEEIVGNVLKDSSGFDRHGSLFHRHGVGRRDNSQSLMLQGESHHGDRGGHAQIPFINFHQLDEFSLALWVKESSLTHIEGEAYITFGCDGGVSIRDALGIANFNSQILFRVGGGEIVVPFDARDRDRWVHYAMTYRDGWLRGFKNGEMVGEAQAEIAIRTERAAIGRHWWGDDGRGTSTRFQGEMDDIRIYDYRLSQQQIQMLMGVNEWSD